jgi:predicted anti-sigma-YlaC factor YlaD
MRCNKAREFLSLELDGIVPPDSTVELEQHLDSCSECQEYRADLILGQRLLAATEPELPENFDWKLQLRLSQTLREAAGDVAYPWEEESRDIWGWVRNFGAAAAVGMAAILSFAVFMGPTATTHLPLAGAGGAPGSALIAESASDRLPLERPLNLIGLQVGNTRQAPARGMSMTPVTNSRLSLDRGWSGSNVEDLQSISRLRLENRRLASALVATQRQLRQVKAQLDTTSRNDLDLGN